MLYDERVIRECLFEGLLFIQYKQARLLPVCRQL